MIDERAQLAALLPADDVITAAADRCRTMVASAEATAGLPELQIHLVDYDNAPSDLRALYRTDSCKAVLDPPTVLVSAAFVLDLEAAFRSFDLADSLLGTQYLRSDDELFALVHRIRADRAAYLKRLRELPSRREHEYFIQALALLMFFFVAHELGHLLDKVNGRSYATFVRADAELEDRVANAVVKLCRHADEFEKYGFHLPAWDNTVDPASDIRERERELAAEVETLALNHRKWFGDEISADRTAESLFVNVLDKSAQKSPAQADQDSYLLVKGLFVAAVYTWYRDLITFGEKSGMSGPPSSGALMATILESRETYIHAASLFGDIHRFTLLRAALAIESLLRSRSDFFTRPEEQRSIWWSKSDATSATSGERRWWDVVTVWQPDADKSLDEALRRWWETECLQRYWLLCILMDTAVKIAYMGCSTGWILDVDRQRGTPQLFFMNFESIREAVRRLQTLA